MKPSVLRCEYAQNPIGVEAARPQLGWLLESHERNQKQSAYRVLVASTAELLTANQGDLWDSGQVKSGESAHVAYAGAPLTSRQRCYWKVRVWDASGKVSDWSQPASWEMALLRAQDWKAKWIGSGPAKETFPPEGFFKSTKEFTNLTEKVTVDGRSTLLRKSFVADKPIRRAEVYVTGLGYYELSCNGQRVGDHVLAPAKSNYRKWVLYDTYDLTAQLREGTNVLGVMLGNGWFNPQKKWWEPYRMQWFGAKRAMVQLHVEYADGSSQVIISDGSWKAAPGPVLASCVFDGEVYDATKEVPNWNQPDTSDSGWKPANIVEPPGGVLVSHLMQPIKVIEHIKSVVVKNPKPGVYVFDLGQNFAGWVRLNVQGPRNKRVTLRYAEDLLPDGNIDVKSNERALATDVYVLKGIGQEVYEPRFTFHGFRYVEVTGFPGTPKPDNLLGCVVHTACDSVGDFECDNELVNRIHRATRWSQRSNLMGYPMDCPQRDERLGWFGDAMVSMEEAMFNFDLPLFYRQWLDGVRFNQNEANGDISIVSPRPYITDEPDPTWSSAYVLMTWQYYLHYGDRQFLAGHFDSMKRYVDFLGTQATNHILPKYWIGDWGTIVEGWKEGEPVSVVTAFYYYDALILAKAADVLGKRQEAEQYNARAKQIKAAFNRTFYDPKKKQYEQGTQFANAFPLFLGLVEPANQSAVLQNILSDLEHRKGHFNVGVLGAKYLIDALTESGKADVAYQLVNQTGFPSWAHMLEGGRTTMSEFWDLKGSHNHVMMGSIDAWFYRTLAGIQPDEKKPGFENIVIKPFIPDTLSFVKASTQTVRGRVAVEWTKKEGALQLKVSIPANSSATVHVPATSSKQSRSTPPLKPARFETGADVYETGSGDYEFQSALSVKAR
ncbi:MAG: family 78 glycoside hydrolase catalytic domain [Verrucomicrobia bacterium]|nr:family 78 glycoside hydrolase catalytic domain [Verrucomicrobiota bacterium]